MGRLYIPSENTVDGPWLFDHAKLESLNNLFIEVEKKLIEALTKHIEITAKQQAEEDGQTLDLPKRIAKLQRKFNRKDRFAEVTFADGSTYQAGDIEAVLNYVDTNPSLTPVELYIRTIHGNSENDFDLIINTNAGKEEVDFEYRISCIDEEIQQKIKSLIDKWIRENKAPISLQIWSNFLVYLIWIFGTLTILFSWANLDETITKSGNYKQELISDSKKMIEHGVSSENIDSAVALLLKLQIDYVPDDVKAEVTTVRSVVAWKIFLTSLIILAVSLIRPRTILGIGRKSARLKLYNVWIRVTYGTLILLVTTMVADSFLHFIK